MVSSAVVSAIVLLRSGDVVAGWVDKRVLGSGGLNASRGLFLGGGVYALYAGR